MFQRSQKYSVRSTAAGRLGLCAAIALLVACLPNMTGCGSFFIPVCQAQNNCGNPSGGTYSSYTYVANATTQNLALFPLPTAAFTTVTGTTTSLGTPPSAIAATPTGSLLYLATAAGPVYVYTVGANGVLTMGNSGSAVVTPTLNPSWMTIDPSGQFLFIVSNSSPVLFEYQIDATNGTLTAVGAAQGTALTGGNPTQVFVTPNNQYVYVGLGTRGVDTFALNSSTGALSNQLHLAPKPGSGISDNALGGDNNSAFLFVGEAGTGIRVLTIGSGGALTEISGSPFTTQLGPKSIIVDSTNTYVYVANSTANAITGYTLAASGALTQLSSSPFAAGTTPVALSLDSTKKYLLAISQGGGPDLEIFSFDSTTPGKLDSVATASTGTDPTGAISLAVVPPPPR